MNGSPKSAVQRVADAVRYWSERLGGGAPLPSQEELAEQFGVSRDTVQKALKLLQEDQLIESIRGSGTFVAGTVDSPVGDEDILEPAIVALDAHLDLALKSPDVTIDYFGFTAETLAAVLKPKLVHMWLPGSTAPNSLHIRLLLPDFTSLALPQVVNDPQDPRALERLRAISHRCIESLEQAVSDLRTRGGVDDAHIEIRTVPMTPQVKLYVINEDLALRGWYLVKKVYVPLDAPTAQGSEDVEIFDLSGLDAQLVRLSAASTKEAKLWFESAWTNFAAEHTLGQ